MEEIHEQILNINQDIDEQIELIMTATKKLEDLKNQKTALERIIAVMGRPINSFLS